MNTKSFAGALVLVLAVLAVAIVALFFTTTVETGSVGVVTNFGRVTARCSTPAGISSARWTM
ncbi:MAG: hypothetical protein WDO13_14715 [Verrucomicrobiota bacterium]